MIEQHELTDNFRPGFGRDFQVFKNQINVQVQYIGPVPEVGRPMRPESFRFAVYQHGVRVDCGTVYWDPENGPLTEREAATAVVVYWGTFNAG